MSTSESPTHSRKRDATQASDYVPNENPQEGWAGIPGSSRVRLVESTSTDILERERSRNTVINQSLNTLLQGLRQTLGPEAQSLSLSEMINAMLLERQKMYEDAESLREQFARHSEDAQVRLDKLKADLVQAQEDNRLTQADASEAREAARLAQQDARQAQTESETLEATLRQQVRRDKDRRLQSATANAPASPSNSQVPLPQTPTGNSQLASCHGGAQSPSANTQTASTSSQPPPASTQTAPTTSQPSPASTQTAPATSQSPPSNPGNPRAPSGTTHTPPNNFQSPPPQPPPGTPGAQQRTAATTIPKEGSRLYHSNLKKTALNSLPTEEKRRWNALFRSCFKKLTGRSKISDFDNYNSVSEATAEAFGDGRGPGPQGSDLYHLYFGSGWRQAGWNQEVIANISRYVLEEVQGDQQPCLTSAAVEGAIWDLVRQAQVSWKTNKPRPVVGANGEERMEDESEAAARQRNYTSHREQRLKINGRKKTKYESRRLGIVDLFEAPSQQDPVSKRKWEMMEEVNEALGTEGQSSEESDREPGKRLSNHAYPLKVSQPFY